MKPASERWPPGATLTVAVGDVAFGGAGIGRVDGKVVMAHGLLPGETAEVSVVRDHGRYAEGRVVRLVSASAQRVAPACPLALQTGASPVDVASVCPGCRYQHAAYETEVELKTRQLRALLARQGRQPNAVCLPAVASPAALGYRNKIVLHVGTPAAGEAGVTETMASPAARAVVLGYYAEDNTTIVDVARCPLAVEAINHLLADVRGDASALAGVRDGAAVTFRHTPADGALWWSGAAARDRGGALTEDSPAGRLTVPRGSFYQVNPAVADRLVRDAVARLAADPPDTLIDLFCGIGVFALAAAGAGPKTVIGVDSDPRAIEAAGRNAAERRAGNVRWLRAAAGPGLRRAARLGAGRVAVIVDPPRAGLGRGLVRDLAALRPDRILYVSCAADTLTRDAAWFLEDGYRIESVRLYDMFPRTAHFETLAELRPAARRAEGGGAALQGDSVTEAGSQRAEGGSADF